LFSQQFGFIKPKGNEDSQIKSITSRDGMETKAACPIFRVALSSEKRIQGNIKGPEANVLAHPSE